MVYHRRGLATVTIRSCAGGLINNILVLAGLRFTM